MKRMLRFAAISLLLCLLVSPCVLAADEPSFDLEEISQEDKDYFFSQFTLTKTQIEPKRDFIKCFDVNEEGWLLLSTEDYNHHHECLRVYQPDGTFYAAYMFDHPGSFEGEWVGDCIALFLYRCDFYITISLDGVVKEVQSAPSTVENSIQHQRLTRHKKEISGRLYEMSNKSLFFLAFVDGNRIALTVTEPNGEKRDLYLAEISTIWVISIVVVSLFMSVGVTVIVVVGILKKRSSCKKANQGGSV